MPRKGQPMSAAHRLAMKSGRERARLDRAADSARSVLEQTQAAREALSRSAMPITDQMMPAMLDEWQALVLAEMRAIRVAVESMARTRLGEPLPTKEQMAALAAKEAARRQQEKELARLDEEERAIKVRRAALTTGEPVIHVDWFGVGPDGAGDSTDDPASDLASELAELAEEQELPPSEPMAEDVWGQRLELWKVGRMWLSEWGAKPGELDCRAPREILDKYNLGTAAI